MAGRSRVYAVPAWLRAVVTTPSRRWLLASFCRLHDCREVVRLEACATHQRAVDARLRHQLRRVRRGDASPVLNAGGIRDLLAEQLSQHRAYEGVRLTCLV